MDLQAQLDAARAETATLKAARDALATKATRLDTIEAAFGDQKALLDNVPALLGAVADAKAYRESLADDIVTAQRVAGLIKADKPEDVAALKASFEALPVANLKALHANLPSTKAAPRIPGSDPNAATGGMPAGGDTKAPNLITGAGFGTA